MPDDASSNDATASPPSSPKYGRLHRYVGRTIVATAIAMLCAMIVLQDHVRTLHSLRKIPGTKAYVMDYYVDYNIGEVREHGIDVNNVPSSVIGVFFPKWMAPTARRVQSAFLPMPVKTIDTGHHCSTVVLRGENGHVFFGRNFDYKHDACLVLKIHGADGEVSSIAVLDLHFLRMNREDFDRTTLFRRIPLLFSPYYLQDGMNRHGVAVSDMSLKGSRPPYEAGKPSVIHSLAMRLILDYAKSAEEAVEILKQYNIHFVGEKCHLMIADATGKSIAVEFVDGKLQATTTKEKWQISTNHCLFGKSEDENDQSCKRYQLASDELAQAKATAAAGDVMNVMQSIAQPNYTMWSSVYDLSTGEFSFAYRQHFEKPYSDQIVKQP